MRILYVHNKYLQRGGEDTTVEAEYNLMKEKGHEVDLLLFDNADIGEGALKRIGAGLNSISSQKSAGEVRRAIGRFRPDIVHVHNFYFTASPSVIVEAHDMKVPVVVTIQNYRTLCANCHLLRDNKVCELCVPHIFPWYGVKYKCYHNSAVHSAMVGSIAAYHKVRGTWRNKVDRYITPADFTRRRLVDSSLNVPAEMFSVKPNFIPDPGYVDEHRQDHYLFVGRLSGEKGVQVLMQAFAGSPDRKLLIAGDGPEREAMMQAFPGANNIHFLGRVEREEILKLMKGCKALVFPSIWYEGLPLTIVESFATGTPVIASALGAMQEMIEPGINGFLFEPGSAGDLIKKLAEFETSNNKQLQLGARNSYMQKYHPDRGYEGIMKIYSEVLKAAPNAR